MNNTTRKLMDIISELKLEDFRISNKEKRLDFHYKEDMDRFFQELIKRVKEEGGKIDNPYILDSGNHTPYHFGKVAYLKYEDWVIQGSTTATRKKYQ